MFTNLWNQYSTKLGSCATNVYSFVNELTLRRFSVVDLNIRRDPGFQACMLSAYEHAPHMSIFLLHPDDRNKTVGLLSIEDAKVEDDNEEEKPNAELGRIEQDPLIDFLLKVLVDRIIKEEDLGNNGNEDYLTELLSLKGFKNRVIALLDNPPKGDNLNGLFTLDLQEFKQVNDKLGHSIGDQVLCIFSRILQVSGVNLKDNIICGRLGGDEFGVFLHNVSWGDIEVYLKAIHKVKNLIPIDFSFTNNNRNEVDVLRRISSQLNIYIEKLKRYSNESGDISIEELLKELSAISEEIKGIDIKYIGVRAGGVVLGNGDSHVSYEELYQLADQEERRLRNSSGKPNAVRIVDKHGSQVLNMSFPVYNEYTGQKGRMYANNTTFTHQGIHLPVPIVSDPRNLLLREAKLDELVRISLASYRLLPGEDGKTSNVTNCVVDGEELNIKEFTHRIRIGPDTELLSFQVETPIVRINRLGDGNLQACVLVPYKKEEDPSDQHCLISIQKPLSLSDFVIPQLNNERRESSSTKASSETESFTTVEEATKDSGIVLLSDHAGKIIFLDPLTCLSSYREGVLDKILKDDLLWQWREMCMRRPFGTMSLYPEKRCYHGSELFLPSIWQELVKQTVCGVNQEFVITDTESRLNLANFGMNDNFLNLYGPVSVPFITIRKV